MYSNNRIQYSQRTQRIAITVRNPMGGPAIVCRLRQNRQGLSAVAIGCATSVWAQVSHQLGVDGRPLVLSAALVLIGACIKIPAAVFDSRRTGGGSIISGRHRDLESLYLGATHSQDLAVRKGPHVLWDDRDDRPQPDSHSVGSQKRSRRRDSNRKRSRPESRNTDPKSSTSSRGIMATEFPIPLKKIDAIEIQLLTVQ